MPTPSLYRLRGITETPHPDQIGTLARGLHNHLAHDHLTTVLVQIGTVQRAYVALVGCAGCVTGQCTVGCRVALLRRTLRAALGDTAVLTLVQRGLDPTAYQRLIWTWPTTKDGQPLDGTLLAGWARARLVLGWSRGRPHPAASALVALSGDGPELAPRLRARGWACQDVPRMVHRLFINPLSPLGHLRRGAWATSPWLVLPASEAALAHPATLPDVEAALVDTPAPSPAPESAAVDTPAPSPAPEAARANPAALPDVAAVVDTPAPSPAPEEGAHTLLMRLEEMG